MENTGILNRRQLRVKVLQSLYAYYQSDADSYAVTEKSLLKNVEAIYDLYLYFLQIFPELKRFAENRIEENRKKIRPSEEDLNPNLKFVNNALIEQIENSRELRMLAEDHKISWVGAENQELLRKMFVQMRESELFLAHMNNGITGIDEDLQFLIAVFKEDIANFELLYTFFEEENINWLDDIDLVCQMVIRTLKNAVTSGTFTLMSLYKDEEDEKEFIRLILQKTISMDKENLDLIDSLTDNWELDRIAKMDVLLMKMAITELQVCNNIPTNVTLNEYIEISKFYSTPKSHGFINGILDKAITKLTNEGKIKKIGRGLMK